MNDDIYPLKLPPSIRHEAERRAAEDGVSLDQWIALALAQKLGAVETAAQFLRRRAVGASRERFGAIMARVPNNPPDPGDELE